MVIQLSHNSLGGSRIMEAQEKNNRGLSVCAYFKKALIANDIERCIKLIDAGHIRPDGYIIHGEKEYSVLHFTCACRDIEKKVPIIEALMAYKECILQSNGILLHSVRVMRVFDIVSHFEQLTSPAACANAVKELCVHGSVDEYKDCTPVLMQMLQSTSVLSHITLKRSLNVSYHLLWASKMVKKRRNNENFANWPVMKYILTTSVISDLDFSVVVYITKEMINNAETPLTVIDEMMYLSGVTWGC